MAQVSTAVSPVKIFGEQPWKCTYQGKLPLAELCDGLHKAHGRLAVWNFVCQFPVKISAKISLIRTSFPPEDKVQFVSENTPDMQQLNVCQYTTSIIVKYESQLCVQVNVPAHQLLEIVNIP